MKNAGNTASIDVSELHIGMFVHLDIGWMSHPFPLSSFRIASPEQIDIIRSLGLKRVRWCPEQSALAELQGQAKVTVAPTAPQVALVETPEAAQRRLRRAAAADERAALASCERQYAEATRECRQLTELVGAQPEAARDRAVALTQKIVDKMLAGAELRMRLLEDAHGDRASAHAVNVALISMLMGRSCGLAEADLLDLGVGALLHDVGKLDLPRHVRHPDEHSTHAETRLYEEHVAYGITQAARMGLSLGASQVIAQHHELADASGFPMRLGSERMTPLARIVSLVNRYDNLCNPMLAAKALTPHEAVSLLFAQAQAKFDTGILASFIKMMGVYPPGSIVQLTDDRYAMVVGVNSTRTLRPRVLILDPRVPLEEVVPLNLESQPNLGIRRSLRPADLPPAVQRIVAPRARVAYFFEPVSETHEALAA
jgi:putative nucleotidyltransferase with HDIG domain